MRSNERQVRVVLDQGVDERGDAAENAKSARPPTDEEERPIVIASPCQRRRCRSECLCGSNALERVGMFHDEETRMPTNEAMTPRVPSRA